MYVKEIGEIENLIQKQAQWRNRCINLIASENIVSRRVSAQAGSDFAHRYAEGHPGERYYRGTSYIDEIENQLTTNLKILFECDHAEVRPRGRLQPFCQPGGCGDGQLDAGRRPYQPSSGRVAWKIH
jgi:glycine/serine hydroxymethyltransferase